jgi:hypothetical protein
VSDSRLVEEKLAKNTYPNKEAELKSLETRFSNAIFTDPKSPEYFSFHRFVQNSDLPFSEAISKFALMEWKKKAKESLMNSLTQSETEKITSSERDALDCLDKFDEQGVRSIIFEWRRPSNWTVEKYKQLKSEIERDVETRDCQTKKIINEEVEAELKNHPAPKPEDIQSYIDIQSYGKGCGCGKIVDAMEKAGGDERSLVQRTRERLARKEWENERRRNIADEKMKVHRTEMEDSKRLAFELLEKFDEEGVRRILRKWRMPSYWDLNKDAELKHEIEKEATSVSDEVKATFDETLRLMEREDMPEDEKAELTNTVREEHCTEVYQRIRLSDQTFDAGAADLAKEIWKGKRTEIVKADYEKQQLIIKKTTNEAMQCLENFDEKGIKEKLAAMRTMPEYGKLKNQIKKAAMETREKLQSNVSQIESKFVEPSTTAPSALNLCKYLSAVTADVAAACPRNHPGLTAEQIGIELARSASEKDKKMRIQKILDLRKKEIQELEKQALGQLDNRDTSGVKNTLLKMSTLERLVSAVLFHPEKFSISFLPFSCFLIRLEQRF